MTASSFSPSSAKSSSPSAPGLMYDTTSFSGSVMTASSHAGELP